MEEVGPHQLAVGQHQEDANLHQAESRGSQHGDPRRSPERREVHKGSVRTTHTTRSHSRGKSHVSRGKSHVSHAKHDGNLQREIADLKRELRLARRERSPPCPEPSSKESDGASYRRRSRTPPSETFSYEEKHRHRRKRRSPPSKGLGNDAMNKALSQISKKHRRCDSSSAIPSAYVLSI
ncbi:zinc finger Ran-binding domain-containing protein 2-like [Quercus lobata]|uniref:zinc finger Ran-binding domain-containing protein 2-like n=1 Tax=Quercus lobata TaxID=97700 RepID=UPI001243C3C6|nr:zinc finger Ran-binding domain-containing protein 2-like [Quercus lobata]